MSKAILKMTEGKGVVKFYGTMDDTLDLATECVATTDVCVDNPLVNILSLHWSGAPDGSITITRNSVIVAQLNTNVPGCFNFWDKEFADTTQNGYNIEVTSTVEAQLWMVIRKAYGFASKIETAQYSVYDDENQVGQ